MRIKGVATDRIQLHWQFEILVEQGGGPIHLRKSTFLPGSKKSILSSSS